jgi:hypothetical protein
MPVTVAVNCCVAPVGTVVEVGEIVTATPEANAMCSLPPMSLKKFIVTLPELGLVLIRMICVVNPPPSAI